MSLGEAITRSTPQALWTCSVLVLGNESADVARSWPSELARLNACSGSCHHFVSKTTSTQAQGTRVGSVELFRLPAAFWMSRNSQVLPGMSEPR